MSQKVKIQRALNQFQAGADGIVHPDDSSGYVLPVASKTILGGVRIGDRITVVNGLISAEEQRYDDTEIRAEVAKKQDRLVSGTNIRTVNGNSLLGSGDIEIKGGSEYVLPVASVVTLGGVKIGKNVYITDGAISVADPYDDTAIRAAVAANVQAIIAANARIDGKQDTLVSGTNIRTINGQPILGSGDIHIQGGGGGDFTLLPATPTRLGGVKVGARLSVEPDGTLSADDQRYDDAAIRSEIAAKQDKLVSGVTIRSINGQSLLGAGNLDIETETYILPPASAEVLGGVKKGANVNIAADGTLSVAPPYDDTHVNQRIDGKQDKLVSGTNIRTVNGQTLLGNGNITIEGGGDYVLPPATETELGGVKVGARLIIQPDGTLSAVDQHYDDTSIRQEIARKQDTLVSGQNIKTVGGQSLLGSGDIPTGGAGGYTLPVASATQLGGVKQGQRVTISGDGTLSADDQHYDDSAIRSEIAAKQDKLVSGVSIKTVNGTDILGSGNITIEGGAGSVPPATEAIEGTIRLGAGLKRFTEGGAVEVACKHPIYTDPDGKVALDISNPGNPFQVYGYGLGLKLGTTMKKDIFGKLDVYADSTQGINTGTNGLRLLLDTAGSPGLEFASGAELGVRVKTGNGLNRDASGISAKPGAGITVDANGISVATGAGITVTGGKVSLVPKKSSDNPLYTDANGINFSYGDGLNTNNDSTLRVRAGDGIAVTPAKGVSVKPFTFGATPIVVPTPFANATASLVTSTNNRTNVTVPGISGTSIASVQDAITGRLTAEFTGNVTGEASGQSGWHAFFMLDPKRADYLFHGMARVTIDGVAKLAPYLNPAHHLQTGRVRSSSWLGRDPTDPTTASVPRNNNAADFWHGNDGMLIIPIVVPLGAKRIAIENFYFASPV